MLAPRGCYRRLPSPLPECCCSESASTLSGDRSTSTFTAVGTENTKISCEGRHRGCPDLVSCILLFSVCSLIQLRGSLPSVSSSSDAATGRLLALSSSAQPQPSTLAPGRCCPESIPPVSGARSLSTFLAVGYGEHQDQLRASILAMARQLHLVVLRLLVDPITGISTVCFKL